MSTLVLYFRKNSIVFGIYLLLVLLIIIFNIFTPLSPLHLLDMFRQAAPLGIAAIGQTLCLLIGGIDLSVGAMISLTNVIACSIMLGNKQNIPVALAIIFFVSLFIGLINGLAVVKAKIPPLLATLAMSIIITGGYYVYTKGSPIGNIAKEFRFISEGWIGFIPVSGIFWLAIWFIFAFFLYRTTVGLSFYSTGETRRPAGFPVFLPGG